MPLLLAALNVYNFLRILEISSLEIDMGESISSGHEDRRDL
jgi:hypothetical protein